MKKDTNPKVSARQKSSTDTFGNAVSESRPATTVTVALSRVAALASRKMIRERTERLAQKTLTQADYGSHQCVNVRAIPSVHDILLDFQLEISLKFATSGSIPRVVRPSGFSDRYVAKGFSE